jgi:GxxExxY protein
MQPAHGSVDTGAVSRQGERNANLSEPDHELDQLAQVVVDAAREVHRVLGPGFLEAVYEQALAAELALRAVPFERQVPIALQYKNVAIGHARLDFLVGGRLVVELKVAQSLLPIHVAQVFSYLKATDRWLGLLINFNVRFIRQGIRRVIRTR